MDSYNKERGDKYVSSYQSKFNTRQSNGYQYNNGYKGDTRPNNQVYSFNKPELKQVSGQDESVSYDTKFGFMRQGFVKQEEAQLTSYSNSSNYSQQSLTWKNRYDRPYYYYSNLNSEIEALLAEHINHQKKNTNFDFEKLMSSEIYVYNEFDKLMKKSNVETFEELGFDSVLIGNILKMKFDKMTPIQKAVTLYIYEGCDIMGCAQTGSGKTIAFLLPMLEKMMKAGPPKNLMIPKTSYPVTLILVPTRELVDQIYKVAKLLTADTGISVGKVYGGVPHENQIKHLKQGVDVLISTTGRLLDFLKSKLVSLSSVRHLIIDEADRLLEMGFEKQLNEILYMHGKFIKYNNP